MFESQEDRNKNINSLHFEAGLLSSAPAAYDAEDSESDRIYASIDARIEERHTKRQKKSTSINQEPIRTHQKLFEDLKRGISCLTQQDWASIPEVGDMTALRPNRKTRRTGQEEENDPGQRYTPMPDFLIEQAKSSTIVGYQGTALDKHMEDGTLTDFACFGAARKRQLGQAIDTLAGAGKDNRNSAAMALGINMSTEAYMTGLTSMPLRSTAEIRDLEKAKMLLRSLVESNPSSVSGWLSLVRLHEGAGAKEEARAEIKRALAANPRSEDLWVEASRLEPTFNTRIIMLRRGLKALPHSPRLWLRLADATSDSIEDPNFMIDPIESNEVITFGASIGLDSGISSSISPKTLGVVESPTATHKSDISAKSTPTATAIQKAYARLKCLKEGLSLISDSLEMWRAAIEASQFLDGVLDPINSFSDSLKPVSVEDASSGTFKSLPKISTLEGSKGLLEAATAALPTAPELWIGLAEAQSTQEATRTILNKARAACPLSHEIWIASACIEELKYSNVSIIPILLNRMLSSLGSRGHRLSRHQCLQLAIECEESGALTTATSLVQLATSSGDGCSGQLSNISELIQQADQVAAQGHPVTGKALLEAALITDPFDEDLWLAALAWEQRYIPDNATSTKYDTLSHMATINATYALDTSQTSINTGIGPDTNTELKPNANISITQTDIRLGSMMARAMMALPGHPRFWLMATKDAWKKGFICQARSLLQKAFIACPDCEEIWLAAAKIERMEGNADATKAVLTRARDSLPQSARIWIRSAQLERALGNLPFAASLLYFAIGGDGTKNPGSGTKEPLLPIELGQENLNAKITTANGDGYLPLSLKEPRLWLMLAETIGLIAIKLLPNNSETGNSNSAMGNDHNHSSNKISKLWVAARKVLSEGCRLFPTYVPLCVAAGAMEQRLGAPMKARAIYEHGRLALPHSDLLWLASVRMEVVLGNRPMAKALLSKGLQACPTSGALWSESIRHESRSSRKTRAADALRKCPEDALVALALARVFWEDGPSMAEKTKIWIERAISLNPLLGDAHAYALLFEQAKKSLVPPSQQNSMEKLSSLENKIEEVTTIDGASNPIAAIISRCVSFEPKYGELWIGVSKDPIANGALIPLTTSQILQVVVDKLAAELDISYF